MSAAIDIDPIATLTEQVSLLSRRMLALEAIVMKRGGLAAVVRKVVNSWPGPFTANQIRDAVYEFFPDHKPVEEHHQVGVIIQRMERQLQIIRTFAGRGPQANIYERVLNPPKAAGHGGNKLGVHAKNESGFRNIVRAALNELPEEWRLPDLREWVGKKMPEARIPYGSWTSTLYKLTQSGELKVRGHRHFEGGKIYSRGEKIVLPSGDELKDLELAWAEFRKQMGSVEIEEPATSLGRHDD